MKSLLLGIFTLFLFSLNGQQFVSQENIWITNEGFYNPAGGSYHGSDYLYKFKESIEIEGKTYLQLYRAKGPEFNEFELHSTLRQDNQKVFLQIGLEEKLMYDFGSTVGDTMIVINFEVYVSNVDSILLKDGSQRKRLELNLVNDPATTLSVIENIGANRNLFRPSPFFITDSRFETLCYYRNEINLFSNNGNECSNFTTSTHDVSSKQFKITFDGEFFKITGSHDNELQLRLYDLNGSLIQSSKIDRQYVKLITPLTSGLVVVQLLSNENQISSQLMFID